MPQISPKKGTGCFTKAILTGLTFFVLAFVVFYFVIWHVPDRSMEIDEIVKKIEEREKKLDQLPPEDNGWTYYKKANEIMDLTQLKNHSISAMTARMTRAMWKRNIPVVTVILCSV